MAALKGEPLKAFVYQDHQAHIQVHTSAMQDPIIAQLVGQNPRAPQIMAAMQAHIAEHVAYAYRQKIEQQLGMALPPEEEKLPPQVELALSSMMAQAAQQVLAESQAQAAQQQAQQQAQDPVVQMQQQELQIKAQEVALKEKKIAADAAARADELALKEKQMQIDAAFKADKLEADQEREGARMGIDIAKSRQQAARPQPTKGKPSTT
jgi:tetrahydrodipicolinate N-succinyltransferase